MYKIFASGLDKGPMVCLAECTNKIAAVSTAIEFLRIINVKGNLIVLADPDSGEDSIVFETIPVLQERDKKNVESKINKRS